MLLRQNSIFLKAAISTGMNDVTANVLCRFMGYKRAFPSEIMDGGLVQ